MADDGRPKIISKFAGEAFGVDNVRTVFVSASEDNVKRDDRVILLIGPAGTGKSTFIDCLCNFYYGATLEGKVRYKIADEIFDDTTPMKAIIRYVFNETKLPYRPVIIDTPGIGSNSGIQTDEEISAMLSSFLSQSKQVIIHAIGFVLRHDETRISVEKERQIKETLSMFPSWMKPNIVPLISSSDRVGTLPLYIKNFLDALKIDSDRCFFFNSCSLFDMSEANALSAQLRKSYWYLTMSELDKFLKYISKLSPQSIAEELPVNKYPLNGDDADEGTKQPITDTKRQAIEDRPKTDYNSRIPQHLDIDALNGLPHKQHQLNGDTNSALSVDPTNYRHYQVSTEVSSTAPLPNYTVPVSDSSSVMLTTTTTVPIHVTVKSDSQQNYTSTKNENNGERIVPIKRIDEQQRWSLSAGEHFNDGTASATSRSSNIENSNTSGTSKNNDDVIRRYVYDPASMTHKEQILAVPKRSSLRGLRTINLEQNSPSASGAVHRPQQLKVTLIDDVPAETLDSKSSSEPDTGLHYKHVKSSPPPAYTPKSEKSLPTAASDYGTSVQNYPRQSSAPPDTTRAHASVQKQILKRSSSKGGHSNSSPTVNARSSWTYSRGTETDGPLPSGSTSSMQKQGASPLRIPLSVIQNAFEPNEAGDNAPTEQPRLLETNIDEFPSTARLESIVDSRSQSQIVSSPVQGVAATTPLIPVFENAHVKIQEQPGQHNKQAGPDPTVHYDFPPDYVDTSSSDHRSTVGRKANDRPVGERIPSVSNEQILQMDTPYPVTQQERDKLSRTPILKHQKTKANRNKMGTRKIAANSRINSCKQPNDGYEQPEIVVKVLVCFLAFITMSICLGMLFIEI